MTVVRYEPWALVNRLQKDIDRLFGAPADHCNRFGRVAAALSTFTRKRISSY